MLMFYKSFILLTEVWEVSIIPEMFLWRTKGTKIQ
jgi:hypothetical protein